MESLILFGTYQIDVAAFLVESCSNDISALKSTGRHTSSSLKFTTDDNPLGDDSDLHSLSEVLPSSSTDFKIHSTTVVNIPIVNQSVGSSVLLSESDKITDSSVMGNQLDSHDIRKLSTNSTVEVRNFRCLFILSCYLIASLTM
ncbi:unnamed protein product [Trichobilharzia regenti]|nr:unnamed protein product [Trichobilharzia regenti]